MIFVINKQKIYSYVVAVIMVVVLFCGSTIFQQQNNNTIQTAATEGRMLPIYNVETKEKNIALTMNCAWNADDIDCILDTLAKYKIHITFFVVGDWIDKYPEALKKMAEAGHEIANHSNTHPHVNNLSYEKNIEQIKQCADKIEKVTGKRSNLYRGPYGEYNNTVIKSAIEEQHTTIQWSLDTLDYSGITGEEMWGRLKDKLKCGDIILMHNGTKHTADSLDKILYNISEKGFHIVTVSELIYKDNYTIDNAGMQKLVKK